MARNPMVLDEESASAYALAHEHPHVPGWTGVELAAAEELRAAGLQLEATFRAWTAAKERHQKALGDFHRATGATAEAT